MRADAEVAPQRNVIKSATIFINGEKRCIHDGGRWCVLDGLVWVVLGPWLRVRAHS